MSTKVTYVAEHSPLHQGWVVRQQEEACSTFVCATGTEPGNEDLGREDAERIAALLNLTGVLRAPNPTPDRTNADHWKVLRQRYDAQRQRGAAWRAGKDRMRLRAAEVWAEGAHLIMSDGEKFPRIGSALGPELTEALAVLWEQHRAQAIELRKVKLRLQETRARERGLEANFWEQTRAVTALETRLQDSEAIRANMDELLGEEITARKAAEERVCLLEDEFAQVLRDCDACGIPVFAYRYDRIVELVAQLHDPRCDCGAPRARGCVNCVQGDIEAAQLVTELQRPTYPPSEGDC